MKTSLEVWTLFQDQVTALARGNSRFKKEIRKTHDEMLKSDRDFYRETMEYRFLFEIFSKHQDPYLLNLYQTKLGHREFKTELE